MVSAKMVPTNQLSCLKENLRMSNPKAHAKEPWHQSRMFQIISCSHSPAVFAWVSWERWIVLKPPWKRLNYQTALSRFQRPTIGSCMALNVIKANTQIRWKYFICIYLFFRLSEYKEIEFIIKCCYPPSLVCFVIYSTSYRKGQVCFRCMAFEYFTLLLFRRFPACFLPAPPYLRLHGFTFFTLG